jgi:hypothetical protein
MKTANFHCFISLICGQYTAKQTGRHHKRITKGCLLLKWNIFVACRYSHVQVSERNKTCLQNIPVGGIVAAGGDV